MDEPNRLIHETNLTRKRSSMRLTPHDLGVSPTPTARPTQRPANDTTRARRFLVACRDAGTAPRDVDRAIRLGVRDVHSVGPHGIDHEALPIDLLLHLMPMEGNADQPSPYRLLLPWADAGQHADLGTAITRHLTSLLRSHLRLPVVAPRTVTDETDILGLYYPGRGPRARARKAPADIRECLAAADEAYHLEGGWTISAAHYGEGPSGSFPRTAEWTLAVVPPSGPAAVWVDESWDANRVTPGNALGALAEGWRAVSPHDSRQKPPTGPGRVEAVAAAYDEFRRVHAEESRLATL